MKRSNKKPDRKHHEDGGPQARRQLKPQGGLLSLNPFSP
jgi:hypothetical protein